MGKTILYVSHAVDTVTSLCSRAVIMDQGELILDGEVKFVTEQYERLIKASKEDYANVRMEISNLY
jgi:lipopolysaccharide transport system ATP-binding protein